MLILIRKFAALICVLTVLFCSLGTNAQCVSADSAVVLNADTGQVVYIKNGHEKRSMASTTKIMTGLIAAASGRLDEQVEITAQMTAVEGTSAGLKPGYRLTLRDLLYCMMLESGNDAANAVAIYLAGSFEAFADKMNALSRQIGMESTNFVTPSGLDAPEHYSTAYDMALLAARAVKNDEFKKACSAKKYTVELMKPKIRLWLTNHNRLLDSYEGAFGVKTGFTQKSGRCLVSAATRGGATYVCVTLNDPDDWSDHASLLDSAFAATKTREIKPAWSAKTLKIYGGTKSAVEIRAVGSAEISYIDKIPNVTAVTRCPKIIYAPIRQGEVLAQTLYYSNGRLIGRHTFVAAEDISLCRESYKGAGLFEWLTGLFS